uniref:conjugative transposon protein TraM n=1 Tax=uncultured Draconibacterium sp. TaxID=1573823 RepID=UPI003217C03D
MKELLIKNKALFFLPLVLIPFVILIFWVLGGGTEADAGAETQPDTPGIGANYDLPEADKSIEIYDKMEAYQQDEQKAYGMQESDLLDTLQYEVGILGDTITGDKTLLEQDNDPKALLAHIKNKEKQLQQELNGEQVIKKKVPATSRKAQKNQVETVVQKKKDVSTPASPSTGIEELDEIIDKNVLLTRKNDSLNYYLQQAQSRLQQIEAIQNWSFTLEKKRSSGFNREELTNDPLIKAEIYETTTVLNGNRIKLRLLEDTRINGQQIPQNSFIYGVCTIKNERLLIEITQLPVENSFIPVKLTICDLDGLEGLYVPGNAARKVYQEVGSSTNTSSLMGVTNNPLTYTGIRAADRAAQTMLKRVRLKKVTVKKNTRIYIINQK